MKKISLFILLFFVLQFTGCIVFNSVTYEVNINEDGTGIALVTIEDINTDATTQEDLDADVSSIFDYGLKGQEFVDEQEKDGKKITSRNLLVEKGKLNAIVRYEFSDPGAVEGMQFDDPYYYLTISPEDSIISTNGQVTKTDQYQRIVWDKSIKTLKFKMYSEDTKQDGLKSLAPYYLKEN